jgi:hypothetical protein
MYIRQLSGIDTFDSVNLVLGEFSYRLNFDCERLSPYRLRLASQG